jgi:23S rRNA pseudouridine2605 synthase
MIRIQKLLANWGIGSRRHIETLISKGEILVDGLPITLGHSVDENNPPQIKVNGEIIKAPKAPQNQVYIFNKPKLVVTTLKDEEGRKCIADFIPKNQRLYPVGRLDMDSTGLLLLTNHGELTNRLLHPSYQIEKEYIVEISGAPLSNAELESFTKGLVLDDGVTQPCKIKKLRAPNSYSVILKEGRNRQVKRMFEYFERKVTKLHRARFGPIKLEKLPRGGLRELNPSEMHALLAAVGLNAPADRDTPRRIRLPAKSHSS